nr:MAG TPA: hypothetical protein [Caudoviricetes sp.]
MGGFKPHGHFPRWAGEALRGWKNRSHGYGPAEAVPQASPINWVLHRCSFKLHRLACLLFQSSARR